MGAVLETLGERLPPSSAQHLADQLPTPLDEVVENAEDGFSPIVEVSADKTSGAAGLKVAFTATAKDADSPELTYSWDFGDGTEGEGLNTTHRYKKTGTYTATFTARSALV